MEGPRTLPWLPSNTSPGNFQASVAASGAGLARVEGVQAVQYGQGAGFVRGCRHRNKARLSVVGGILEGQQLPQLAGDLRPFAKVI
jgi:hypothetical protein